MKNGSGFSYCLSGDVSDQLSRADRVGLFMQAASQPGHPSCIPPGWATSLSQDNPWLSSRDSGQAGESIRCRSHRMSELPPSGTSGFCSSWAHVFSPSISHVEHSAQSLVCAGGRLMYGVDWVCTRSVAHRLLFLAGLLSKIRKRKKKR